MESSSRVKVLLIDGDDRLNFVVRRSDQEEGTELMLDDFTAEAFKEFGDIFTEGLSLSASNEQSITAAITNVSDLLKMILDNYDSNSSSFKCILATSCSNSDGINYVSKQRHVSGDIFHENYVLLSNRMFSAMRKTKAGNLSGSNIYRLVHCIVNQGGAADTYQPYLYACFTIFLQACMFLYVCCHSLLNMPHHDEEVRDTMAVINSGFWGPNFSILRVFDWVSNVLMPIILLPIGVLLVLTGENLLEAVLSSTAVLFIPTLDNDIIGLMGESDSDVVKKHVAQETIHEFADHFFQFQNSYAHEEGADEYGDLEGGPHMTPGGNRPLVMAIENPPEAYREVLIEEPTLCDLALTGEDVLLSCTVFDAFCNVRKVQPSRTFGSHKHRPLGESFQEVFFAESQLVSPNSLFTHLEYMIEETEPYAILYLKLVATGDDNTVEYRTKRYSDSYPIRRIESGCFIVTNISITDCVDTLRLCWSPSPQRLLQAFDFYTVFNYDEAAERLMKKAPVSNSPPLSPTRRVSVQEKALQRGSSPYGYQAIG
eukprot:CAMPEP_0173325276 /NCGR_PEP_ID=MMETSP1144-20121109/417_1 /TAXON_ID=483371 /ORGANISM="non described non described, Strain CCMP2298" /LENGTH=540 /DNA_ID=CAMNT_0014269451 /DNA_START=62 /DNA_END=1683 /DNA_ORIENTATION=-